MSRLKNPKPRFKVGQWVSFPFGTRNVVALIIEDRGPIGYKGRRLYRIELPIEDCEPDRFEVAEEDLTVAAPPEHPAKVS